MFNEDWSHFYYNYWMEGIDVDLDVIKEFIYRYKDTQITDFSMNINAQIASYPSKVMESFIDKYRKEEEAGEYVDYKNTFAKLVYDIYEVKGIDMYAVWIDTLREIGIRPWLSFRMNDCHHNWRNVHLMISDLYRESKQLQRVRHRGLPDKSISRQNDDAFYWDRCFDYAKKEVREYMLAFIDEALGRYDTDGVELDFTREIPAFQMGAEAKGRKIMTNFLADVKAIVEKHGKARGKRIEISTLVGADPTIIYNWGYDVVEWAKRGLIDTVIALPRWATTYTELPVGMWKKLLEPYGVEFAAGTQILTADNPEVAGCANTLSSTMGCIAAYRSQGSDFTYLYNYMYNTLVGYRTVYKWTDIPEDAVSVATEENLHHVFTHAGDTEIALRSRRRHLVSYYDFPNYWDKTVSRLPIECKDSRYYEFASF